MISVPELDAIGFDCVFAKRMVVVSFKGVLRGRAYMDARSKLYLLNSVASTATFTASGVEEAFGDLVASQGEALMAITRSQARTWKRSSLIANFFLLINRQKTELLDHSTDSESEPTITLSGAQVNLHRALIGTTTDKSTLGFRHRKTATTFEWHRRLGHINNIALSQFMDTPADSTLFHCEMCP